MEIMQLHTTKVKIVKCTRYSMEGNKYDSIKIETEASDYQNKNKTNHEIKLYGRDGEKIEFNLIEREDDE